MARASCTVIQCCVLIASSSLAADNWPSFRGNGSNVSTATHLPDRWSPQSGIAWKVLIPGYGQSAPVVWNGTVFVTSSDGPLQENLQVHAFDLASGDKRWTREIEASTKVENYFRNSRAAPTCAVDNDAVYSFFASGDVTALTHQGEVIWNIPLLQKYGPVENERGIATSPAQSSDKLFIVIDHHGPSYIVAINKRTGEIAWKTDRGKRVPSWSSPIVTSQGDSELVLISSSDSLDAYDTGKGKRLWQLDGLVGNHIPSATVVGNRIYVGSSSMAMQDLDEDAVAGSNCCVEMILTNSKPDFQVVWGAERANSAYSSPIAFAGYVYFVNNVGVLYCVNEQTGKQVFAKRMGEACWASAIGAVNEGEPRIYFFAKNGFTTVLRPGEAFDVVAKNQLWSREEMIEASEAATLLRKSNTVPPEQAVPKTGPEKVFKGMPEAQMHQMFSYGDPLVYGVAAVDEAVLIRTGQHLYCIRSAGDRSVEND